jgi:radical SAM superfamily enzyme YgiQ (UPF0313 family)
LGLVTVAALFPPDWELRLVDMNAERLTTNMLEWADVVCTGGMLPQQTSILEVIDAAHAADRPVLVGGADPSSQPDIYARADFQVIGESETTVSRFLEDYARGATGGRYTCSTRPAMNRSPVPRFDLLRFEDYLMMGVQFSRGCPFGCEFCDIIELFGRVPRTKSPQQVVAELDELYRLGYRGHVDFVDDNFIGHKEKVKELLRAVKLWWISHDRPFYFSTEASINLADDVELLSLMRDLDFRYVFVGIETPEPETLRKAKKAQNLGRSLIDDLKTIYGYGIIVNAGFILGFDGESDESAHRILEVVQRGCIPMAMIGLLYALPNTQLARRLQAEGRLLDRRTLLKNQRYAVDQASAGLNFQTDRPRDRVLRQYVDLVRRTYRVRAYYRRVRDLCRLLRPNYRTGMLREGIVANAARLRRLLRALRPFSLRFFQFLRVIVVVGVANPRALEAAINLMAMHLHFASHVVYLGQVYAEVAEGDTSPDSGPSARRQARRQ